MNVLSIEDLELDEPPRRRFRDILQARVRALQEWWGRSLTVRVMASLSLAGLVALIVTGVVVTAVLRARLFDASVDTIAEQFQLDAERAQASFDALTSPTAGQAQQIANELVVSLYDPSRGAYGATLLQGKTGDAGATYQILGPSTASAVKVTSVVTPDLRKAVQKGSGIFWQSVDLPFPDRRSEPGIVMGSAITIPGAGTYELYSVYSLANQEGTVRLVMLAMISGSIFLIILLGVVALMISRIVLRPVREASRNAKKLADGDFDTRMKVTSYDELGQLAVSFNSMASSLEDQFTQLEQLSQVQTNFVSAVSHELRSPVTTIRMAGQLIYDKRDELPPALRRSAELQHKQLLNLDTMLSDLLEISRFDIGGMVLATSEADIGEIASSVVQMAGPLADDNGVEVTIQTMGDVTGEFEPRRIERIIRNLVVNAVEHSEGRPVKVLVAGNETTLAVRVDDHGIGLTPEQAEHVFDRFWRADTARVRKTGGTGLGLTIAREDATLHNGTLECVGEPGVGSSFLLVIPKHPEARTPLDSPLPLVVGALDSVDAADAVDAAGTPGTTPSDPALSQPPLPESALPESKEDDGAALADTSAAEEGGDQ